MQFEHLATASLDLVPQLQWLWHSAGSSSFVVGDERVAFALSHDNLGTPSLLKAARPHDASSAFHHPCNLPVPESLYEEFIGYGWCGFHFLPSVAYDNAVNDAVGRLVIFSARSYLAGRQRVCDSVRVSRAFASWCCQSLSASGLLRERRLS